MGDIKNATDRNKTSSAELNSKSESNGAQDIANATDEKKALKEKLEALMHKHHDVLKNLSDR